ncbi:MAG: CDP-alcohol phosphatidyltransferase family protein [Actinobacteria bacterium]|nr:CDP-alcohol phosphatidyltransferase family protein [Actinomycetota bacterium]
MLNNTNARAGVNKVIEPIARGLIKIGLTPDAITIIGTTGTVAAAFIFLSRGSFLIGSLVIAAFILSDMLDGTMARMQGRTGKWGAFLDSTLDRVADGAIFVSLLIYFTRTDQWGLVIAITICLIASTIISYAKARAEGLGMTCNVGFAERTERLIIVMVPTFLAGLGVPYIQAIAIWALAGLTVLTVFQRMVHIYHQASAQANEQGAAS